MRRKKLVIISHTEHHLDNGVIKGWGSTINEINYLADYWEEVIHVACLHQTKTPPSSLPYTKNNIVFIPIPPFGGRGDLVTWYRHRYECGAWNKKTTSHSDCDFHKIGWNQSASS